MDTGLIWILAGVILLGGELLLPGVFLLWIGLATVATGLFVMAFDPTLASTVLVFNVVLLAAVWIGLRFRGRTRGHPAVNSPVSGLVGRAGLVIASSPGSLRVRVGDSDWPARLPKDVAEAAEGAAIRVEGVDGMTLVVRPLSA